MTTATETLCYTPATELARMIREKEMSPVEIVDAFLARIDEVNPKLNAYVTVIGDKARAAAKQAEADVQSGKKLGPLHGVPVSIKDLALTEGVRTTFGSKVHENFVPDYNEPTVERLLGAGAINLGKTNTPEFGWLAITDNDVFGRTNNPWDVERTSSGSSGGAAAATAAGLAPISLGSDGGGSIRHPAAFCGLFGIKATFGVVPRDSQAAGWPTLSHSGPLTRTVADGALALDTLAGYDARDLHSAPMAPQNFLANLKRDMKGVRVAWSSDLGGAEVEPDVRTLFEAATSAFEEVGCDLRPGHPDFGDVRETFKMTMFPEAVAGELRFIDDKGASKMNADFTKFIWKRRDILARDYLTAQEDRRKMYGRVATFFSDVDLLITPTMAVVPFKHPRDMSEYPHTVNGVEVTSTGWHPFTFPFNLTGQPAATVPCGFTEAGLPVGLQIVGRKYEDLLVMQAAAAFEEARPWADRRPQL